MPLGPGVRYRVKTGKGGKMTRLAFRGNKVIEATDLGKKKRKKGKKKKSRGY